MGDIPSGPAAERMEILMGEIRALGRLPRRRMSLGEEYYLATRLRDAKRRDLLSESQLAELAQLEGASAEFERSEGAERLQERRETLMGKIRALGHIPRFSAGSSDESALAIQLRRAKRLGILTRSQLAEVAELPSAAVLVAARRMETLMDEIRILGHIPRQTPGNGEEYTLACRLRYAKQACLFSDAQLAELADMELRAAGVARSAAAARMETLMAQIRALGHLPRLTQGFVEEHALADRLRQARRKRLLSDSQLAELVEIERSAACRLRGGKRQRLLSDSRSTLGPRKRRRAPDT